MNKLKSIQSRHMFLEIYECESCGYQIGFDVTYLEEMGDLDCLLCPYCSEYIQIEKSESEYK